MSQPQKPVKKNGKSDPRRSFRAWRESVLESPELYAREQVRRHYFAHLLVLMVAGFVVIFLLYANFAKIEETARGVGQVIPSSQVQVVGNLEGGILSEILVREGDVVEEGQVLLRVENRLAEADYKDITARALRLRAKIIRLNAEKDGKSTLEFPDDLMRDGADVVASERSLFKNRLTQLKTQIDVLEAQVSQKRQELSQYETSLRNLSKSLELAQEQQQILKKSVERGVAPRIDLLNSERTVNELTTDLENTRLQIPAARAAIQEASSRVKDRLNTAKTEIQSELLEAEKELASLNEQLGVGRDRVDRTEIRSPLKGTVKDIKLTTIGGVIQPGEDLVEVVPLGDTLIVEARIKPSDIAFIEKGQRAAIRLSSYDYTIYGTLEGKVIDISADTIQDEKGLHFYRVRLGTDAQGLSFQGQMLPILPGMQASVDIITGKRTLLDYLLKPVIRARDMALRER